MPSDFFAQKIVQEDAFEIHRMDGQVLCKVGDLRQFLVLWCLPLFF